MKYGKVSPTRTEINFKPIFSLKTFQCNRNLKLLISTIELYWFGQWFSFNLQIPTTLMFLQFFNYVSTMIQDFWILKHLTFT